MKDAGTAVTVFKQFCPVARQQLLLLCEHGRRQITLPRIRKQYDHRLSRTLFARRNANRRPQRCTG